MPTDATLPNWPLFIGFYTPEYLEEANALIETLVQFSLPHEIQARKSRGSWFLNTQIKAELILDVLTAHPGRPLVYVDCDARVRQEPVLLRHLAGQCDMAAHYRKDGRLAIFTDGRELLSGTLFFSGSKVCATLVEAWIFENQRRAAQPRINPTSLMDQRALQAVLEGPVGRLVRFQALPPTYVQIFDLMRAAGAPVIEHMQASRRLRSTI